MVYMLLYLDDIIIIGDNEDEVIFLISMFNTTFALNYLAELHYFLGIEVAKLSNGDISLIQYKYVNDILAKASMELYKPISSPMLYFPPLFNQDPILFDRSTFYRSMVSAFQFITLTCRDITFVVNKCYKFISNLKESHWSVVKCILHYLQGIISHGVVFKPSTQLVGTRFLDVYYGSYIDDRKSTSGVCVCFFLCANLTIWSSKKQYIISRSSTEAKHRALANVATKVFWLKALLYKMYVYNPSVPVISCDNLSIVALSAISFFMLILRMLSWICQNIVFL